MKRKRMTDQDKERIIALRKEGMYIEEIASIVGFAYHTVSRFLRLMAYEADNDNHFSFLTADQIRQIIDLRKQGKCKKDIIRIMGISETSVKRYYSADESEVKAKELEMQRRKEYYQKRHNSYYHLNRMGKAPTSQEQKEKILYLRNQGLTLKEVSRVSGSCVSIVQRALKEWKSLGFDVYDGKSKSIMAHSEE